MSCCTVPRVHVGDVGTKLRLVLVDQQGAVINISSASTKEIRVARPDGSTFDRAASFVTDGTDGAMEILSEAGDFTESSPNYKMQGHVIQSGLDIRTDVETFEVEANL